MSNSSTFPDWHGTTILAVRKDGVTVKPHQVILVGIALAAVFVVTLILVVRLIIRSAGA